MGVSCPSLDLVQAEPEGPVSKDGRTKVVAPLISVHASRRSAAQDGAALLLGMRSKEWQSQASRL